MDQLISRLSNLNINNETNNKIPEDDLCIMLSGLNINEIDSITVKDDIVEVNIVDIKSRNKKIILDRPYNCYQYMKKDLFIPKWIS